MSLCEIINVVLVWSCVPTNCGSMVDVSDGSTGYDGYESPSTGGQEHAAPADYLMSLALATNQPLHAFAHLYTYLLSPLN